MNRAQRRAAGRDPFLRASTEDPDLTAIVWQLVEVEVAEGVLHWHCRGCGESGRFPVRRGEAHVVGILHEPWCPVLAAAGTAARRRRGGDG
jgi:hypothetical protein